MPFDEGRAEMGDIDVHAAVWASPARHDLKIGAARDDIPHRAFEANGVVLLHETLHTAIEQTSPHAAQAFLQHRPAHA